MIVDPLMNNTEKTNTPSLTIPNSNNDNNDIMKTKSPTSPSLQIKKIKSLEFSKKSVPLEYSATISIKNNFVLPIPFTADSELTYTFSTKPGDISF